jgi:exportin-2 (importin alpha re-exporter)
MLEKMLPDIQKTPAKDRKVVMIGLAVLLTQSEKMLTPPGINAW